MDHIQSHGEKEICDENQTITGDNTLSRGFSHSRGASCGLHPAVAANSDHKNAEHKGFNGAGCHIKETDMDLHRIKIVGCRKVKQTGCDEIPSHNSHHHTKKDK